MRKTIYLINPINHIISLNHKSHNFLNKYRIWKPLGLLVVAGLTPKEWTIKIIDENIEIPDYNLLNPPDLVGLSAFTSQSTRAYEIAKIYKKKEIPVIMGGIHASMCPDEALEHVHTIVTGEAEGCWKQVIADFENGTLKRQYKGNLLDMKFVPPARHDLLEKGYFFGSIQTTRGCPLNCSFCSVSVFNGKSYRHRPIKEVINELKIIKEKFILIVDDNLIGTSALHIERAKELFRNIIQSGIKKKFIAQVTVNIGQDIELLKLAKKAGLTGVFIGFESHSTEGLKEIQKNYNIKKLSSVISNIKNLKKHRIFTMGSFIIGLDVDKKETGKRIVTTAEHYGIELINIMLLTPLPGTILWKESISNQKFITNRFPEDWKYFTLSMPTIKFANLTWQEIFKEINVAYSGFYSFFKILKRFFYILLINRSVLNAFAVTAASMNYLKCLKMDNEQFKKITSTMKNRQPVNSNETISGF